MQQKIIKYIFVSSFPALRIPNTYFTFEKCFYFQDLKKYNKNCVSQRCKSVFTLVFIYLFADYTLKIEIFPDKILQVSRLESIAKNRKVFDQSYSSFILAK